MLVTISKPFPNNFQIILKLFSNHAQTIFQPFNDRFSATGSVPSRTFVFPPTWEGSEKWVQLPGGDRREGVWPEFLLTIGPPSGDRSEGETLIP